MKVLSFRGLIVAAVSFASLAFVNSAQAEDGIATPIAAEIGQMVQLDPTDGFVATSNIALRPVWSWVSRPATSVADISDVTALRPTFTVDVDGTYVAQLELFDAADPATSQVIHSLTVEVGTGNLAPVAHAAFRGIPDEQTSLLLDATKSFDVDGDSLTYSWVVETAPSGATVTIADAASPLTDVQYDEEGEYVFALIVQDDDGVFSETTHLRLFYQAEGTYDYHCYCYYGDYDDDEYYGNCSGEEERQVAPVASFVFDQVRGVVGMSTTLDSHNSTDVDGDALVSDYSIAVAPVGSIAGIDKDQDAFAIVTPDILGDYLVSVGIYDGFESGYDQVLVVTDPAANIRPIARIGRVPDPHTGSTYALDGAQSYDFDGEFLSYRWSVLSKPVASVATLTNNASPFAEIVPDVTGLYIFQLIVDDGKAASVPATMVMKVDAPLPVAHAGADVLLNMQSDVTLDGTLSMGGALSYSWSVLGLAEGGYEAELDDPELAMPELWLPFRREAFKAVLATDTVYRLRGNDTADHCKYDTRLPNDIPWADPYESLRIKLKPKGRIMVNGIALFVWEIRNKREATQTVRLETQSGVVQGSYSVPGKTSAFVTTSDIGGEKLGAWVGDARVALRRKKNQHFGRSNPVCTGASSTVAQLTVFDATGISLPDTVFVSSGNLRPILMPTTRITAQTGMEIALSATDYAFDANSDLLGYSWSILYRPQGSGVLVDSDPTIIIAIGDTLSFIPDRSGLYIVQITASDDTLMARPAVIEIEVSNARPVAIATGPAQVFVGETAMLDGSGSFDPDGDALSYQWTITSQPIGSTATIPDPFGPIAPFVPDVRGDYVFSLVVSDFEFTSTAAIVALTVPNRAPIAALQGLGEAAIGEIVVYSAATSNDPDGDPLTYAYAVISSPSGSQYSLSNSTSDTVELIADIAGDYIVEVTVSDGQEQALATATLTATSVDAPPVLGSLNTSYTVELGLELSLYLTGSDPDGGEITFFTTSFPLPDGFSLDATTGHIRFRPEAGQEGSFAITIGVSDGRFTDTAVLNVEVIPGSAGDTRVHGRLLDAADFANGTETPLIGIPVRLRDAALTMVTDANGEFSFGGLSSGPDQIIVEPSSSGGPGGYMSALRVVQVTENQDRDIAPDILLSPLNEGCAAVISGQETVLSGTTSGVIVTIPADTIETTSGGVFNGDVCLGTLPELFAHNSFPQDTQSCRIYALDAPGAVFTQGISISAPNLDQLPEQTRLHLWRPNRQTGKFRRAATASVDTGGSTVSTQTSSFNNGSLFAFLPQAPIVTASADQAVGNRRLSIFEGDLSETYTLPGYTAFDREQKIGMTYHSTTANPTIIVARDVTIASDSSLPVSLSTRLDISGLSISDTTSWTPRQGVDGSTPALIGEQVSLRQSLLLDASGFASGRYDYTFISQAKFACSTVSSIHADQLYVQNKNDSPYGTGWAIDGLQELIIDPDGGVVITDDESIVTFDPEPSFTNFDEDKFVFPAIGVQGLAIADFDGNGYNDIAFGNSGTGAIGFVYNYGNNEYELGEEFVVAALNEVPEDLTLDYAPNLRDVVAIDINNDGLIDIAFGTQLEKRVDYLINNGDGSFTLQPGFQFVGLVRDLEVADFDNDGMDDLAIGALTTGSFGKDKIYIAYANGSDLDLTNAMPSTTRDHLLQLVSGDIDGDGFVDIAYRSGVEVNFLFNDGDRSYTLYEPNIVCVTRFPLGDYSDLADFNEDGYLDFLYTTQLQTLYCQGPYPDAPPTVDLFLNSGGRTFDSSLRIDEFPLELDRHGGGYVFALDANGDNHTDIVRSEVGAIAVYAGLGDGTFLPPERGLLDYELNFVEPYDIDGEGTQDLISAQRFSVTIQLTNASNSGALIAGPGEFSTLEKQADGTWLRRYKDGNIVEFNAVGLQTAEIDTHGNRREFAYTAEGSLSTITDQLGNVTEFGYTADGKLASITYPDGRETIFSFDVAGTLIGIQEPDGGEFRYRYDENGRLVIVTDQRGNTTEHSYTSAGSYAGTLYQNGASVQNQAGAALGIADIGSAPQPLSYVEPNARISRHTDEKGGVTYLRMNEFGAIIEKVDPLGRYLRMTRNSDNLVTRVERPTNNPTTPSTPPPQFLQENLPIPPEIAALPSRVDEMEYDAHGNMTIFRMAVGTSLEREKSFVYDPDFSNVISYVDYDGFATINAYDNFGDLLSVTDPEGNTREYTYNPIGLIETQTDENGNTTNFGYNANLNIQEITLPDFTHIVRTYDTRGNVVQITEALGFPEQRSMLLEYDLDNRITSEETVDATGTSLDGKIFFEYDIAGNMVTSVDETGLLTEYVFDPINQLTSETTPGYGTTTYAYNSSGEMISETDAEGITKTWEYDIIGEMTRMHDGLGNTSEYVYNIADTLAEVTDQRGNTTVFGFDIFERRISRTNPIGQVIGMGYDGRDNLVSLTREDGSIETATYDGLSRRVTVTTPDNVLNYTYDGRGNLTAANDNDSGLAFTYDNRHRLITATTDAASGLQPAVTLTYSYDHLSQRNNLTDGLGGTWAYVFDERSRVKGLTAPWGDTYSMGYDSAGRRLSLQNTTGRDTQATYASDRLSQLTHVQNGVTIANSGYAYDPDGSIALIRDLDDSTKSRSLAYDNINRLLMVSEGTPVADGGVPIPVEDYAYDPAGNRTASHQSNTYQVDGHNRLLSDGTYAYTYDDKGNRITRTRTSDGRVETFTYNAMNQLTAVSSTDGITATYAYNAIGHRIAKTVGADTTAYVYDISDMQDVTTHDILLEYQNGALSRRWLNGQNIDEPLAYELYTSDTTPGFGTAYALHADRQGSVIAVTDQATGTLAARYKYDAFGAREQTVSLISQPYGFTGREYDGEAGLYHYRARTYDPAVGRFLQSDPLGFAAGDLNIYAYTWNDPANWSDPSGLTAAGDAAEFMMFGNAVVAVVGEAAVCLANKISTALSSIGTLLEEGRNIGDIEKVNAAECVTAFVAPMVLRRKSCGCGGRGGRRSRSSFPVGTEVLTPTGPVAIETLREGDLVIARNEDTGQSGVFPVAAVMGRQAQDVLWVTMENASGTVTRMGVTSEHPLFIVGIGWGDAGELVAGDAIRDKDLRALTVLAVEVDTRPQMVHNLEIADAHTYFAGELEAWGHNGKLGRFIRRTVLFCTLVLNPGNFDGKPGNEGAAGNDRGPSRTNPPNERNYSSQCDKPGRKR